MRSILLSKHFIVSAQQALNQFLDKNNKNIKIAFCSNAGEVYDKNNREYIDISKKELESSGYQLFNLDLNNSKDNILKLLNNVNATFFTGGSIYYLMSLFNKSSIVEDYIQLLNNGLVHIGFSAGAMVCSKDFKAYDIFGKQEFYDPNVTQGLGIFPYYIIPHYFDKPKYTDAYEKVLKAGFTNVIPLTNNQAIIVEKNKWKIVQ